MISFLFYFKTDFHNTHFHKKFNTYYGSLKVGWQNLCILSRNRRLHKNSFYSIGTKVLLYYSQWNNQGASIHSPVVSFAPSILRLWIRIPRIQFMALFHNLIGTAFLCERKKNLIKKLKIIWKICLSLVKRRRKKAAKSLIKKVSMTELFRS